MTNLPDIITLGEGEHSLDVPFRISGRARRVSLRIDPHKGVMLVVPKRVSLRKAKDFLHKSEWWLRGKLAALPAVANTPFDQGVELMLYGQPCLITHSGKLRGVPVLDNGKLVISGPPEHTGRKVREFLKNYSKQIIAPLVGTFATELGVTHRRITVRDTSSRWGSCSHDGNLSFSWRLILAPREVLDYVVAHEVAHRKEMSHSPAFWQVVQEIYPDYKRWRQWLKAHGHTLHRWG